MQNKYVQHKELKCQYILALQCVFSPILAKQYKAKQSNTEDERS